MKPIVRLIDLAAQVEPIANQALTSDDPDVLKVATILSALMGCIGGEGDPRLDLLDALATQAYMICDHAKGHPTRS